MPVSQNPRQASKGCHLALLGVVVVLLVVQGCATIRPRHPLPAALEEQVQVRGFKNIRAWGDHPSKSLTESAVESIKQERAAYGEESLREPAVFLALSGGGDNGAFGAGVLCGWSAAGTRPRFKLVTGISTGALLAPFAFLGSDYDSKLKIYTMVTQNEIFRKKSLLTAFWRDSVADTKPLADLLAKYIDASMLQAIAAEHKKGRRLFIGTTQFDAQRLVIWNMGAIAASGHPEALNLFRKILLASASIPGAFPPQYIKVEADGQEYEEMHVDGGTIAEVILYEDALKPFGRFEKTMDIRAPQRQRRLYIIRNGRIKPDWEKVKPRLVPIAARAIGTLIKTQAVGDLYRLYAFAHRDGIDYNLAAIPRDFPPDPKEMFDKAYMNQLFNSAYEMAKNGYPWQKHPPSLEPKPVPKPRERGAAKEEKPGAG